MYSAEKFGWKVIECTKNGELRSIDEIAEQVLREVSLVLNA